MAKQEILAERRCYACGSNTTYCQPAGYYVWHCNGDTGLYMCDSCYKYYIVQPKVSRERKNRRIIFKGKEIRLPFNPRTGICSKCGKSVKRGEIKITTMHHLEYDENNPLAHTIKLCVCCHNFIHNKNLRAIRLLAEKKAKEWRSSQTRK